MTTPKGDDLDHLKMLADSDFDGACVWAYQNLPSVKSFFDTWAANCGAPKDVFIGHTVKMLIGIDK